MKRIVPLLAVLLTAARFSPTAAQAQGMGEPVVDLPPILVEGLNGKGPRWKYARIPGFEILSCAEDDATERFTLKLYRLEAELTALISSNLLVRFDEPTTLIFYPQSRAESLSREMMEELERAQVARNSPGRVRAPPNLDMRDPDSSVLFSIIEDGGPAHSWHILGSIFGGLDLGSLVLSPEHVAARAPSPPPWFVVGFARFYSSVMNSEEGMRFSPDPWLGDDEARRVRNRPDAFRPTLPLAELLIGRFPRAKADFAGRAYRELWMAEAELFVRWCVDGKMVAGGSARNALWQLVDAASRQPVTETLFRHYFGMGFSDARDELSDYLATTVGRQVQIHLDGLGPDPVVELSDAPPEVIHRIKGDWARRTLRLVREKYPKLLPVYIQQARDTLQKSYDQGEKDPRLVADLGLLYSDIGEDSAARHYLEESFRSGPMRASALAQLAHLRLEDAKRHPQGEADRLSADQLEAILVPLRVARRASPPQILTYLVAAELGRFGPKGSSAELQSFLTEGADRFPLVGDLIIDAVRQETGGGESQRALHLAELGMWTTTDPAVYAELKSARNALLQKPTK